MGISEQVEQLLDKLKALKAEMDERQNQLYQIKHELARENLEDLMSSFELDEPILILNEAIFLLE